MSPSRHVWLTPRDLERDFGPVRAVRREGEGASGRLHYRTERSLLRTAALVLGGLGAGLVIASPLLALRGETGLAAGAIALGAVHVMALRLSMIVRARDRTLGQHGRFLLRLADLRGERVRAQPMGAAMRLAAALSARARIDDARDVRVSNGLRAFAPIVAGIWLAGEGAAVCAAIFGAALVAGALVEGCRMRAAFVAEVAGTRFGNRAARFVAGWPTWRSHGVSTAPVDSLRRRSPITTQARAVRWQLRSSALFRLGPAGVPIAVLLLSPDMSPAALIGLAVAAAAAGQAGAVWGCQAVRAADARHRSHRADRLFTPAPAHRDRVERIETLEVEELAFRYPRAAAPVFEHVTFSLGRGEVLALASPSGSGKTTLLRILTGLAEPSEGRVRINGQTGAAYRHRVAAVFQDEEIGAGTIRAAISGGAGIDLDAAWEAAARVGADDLIRALPMQMQTLVVEGPFPPSLLQPLLIARGLAQRPDMLFLDEALGALPLDRARSLLDSLRAEGALVIFASHDPDVVALADKVVAPGS